MKTPRFYLGSILLFWGWQVNILWAAVLLAVFLEMARSAKTKFEFRASDFNKFVDMSTIFLAGTIVVALTIDAQGAILILLKWLPLIFSPVICAQEVSIKGKMDVKSFFLVSRRKPDLQFYNDDQIDVSYIFSFICVLSAGTANTKGLLFYVIVVVFFIWAVWEFRSRRVAVSVWAVTLLGVIILGFIGQKGLYLASRKFNQWIIGYYKNYYGSDPFKAATALGEIGELKLSNNIIMRVKYDDYRPGKSYLLHTASYNQYFHSTWFAKSAFDLIKPQKESTFWQINPDQGTSKKMVIYSRPRRKKAVLCLPAGVVSISQMPAGRCEKNTLQAVRVEDVPSLIKSVVSYVDNHMYDEAPKASDFFIPKKELPAISAIAKKLALESKSRKEVLETIKNYFSLQYTYSLDLKGKGSYQTPLENFFYHTKSGHCEFFATATVLILRQVKIPARYATGFIAHEYSNLEKQLIVRKKDAHAWVKVYIDGQWENFDTTPASFLQIDAEQVSSFFVADLISFLAFKLSQLRHETGAELMKRFGLWLLLPLVVILFLRLRKSNSVKKVKIKPLSADDRDTTPDHISFYLIEEILTEKGFSKYPHETYFSWLRRIGRHFQENNIMNHLHHLLHLHNKDRFSEFGLSDAEKIQFNLQLKTISRQLQFSPD